MIKKGLEEAHWLARIKTWFEIWHLVIIVLKI